MAQKFAQKFWRNRWQDEECFNGCGAVWVEEQNPHCWSMEHAVDCSAGQGRTARVVNEG